MATIIETDTALWLHNKIGNNDNQWSTGGIASQFNKNVLQNIYDCFLQLDTKSKIKLLLSFLEIPLRNMEELQHSIDAIVDLAESDPDEWVKVVSNIVKDYPVHHVIDKSLGKVATSFQETVEEVVGEVGRLQTTNLMSMLPLECSYLNRTALAQMIPNMPTSAKHFTLRRKPKSAALRAKIAQKASDAANQRRMSQSSSSTAASGKASLKRTNSLQNRVQSVPHKPNLSKTSALPKKTKLLDITEQPLGAREQKKRKKMLAMEASLEEAKQRKQAADLQQQKSEEHHEEEEKTDTADTETDTEREAEDNEYPADTIQSKTNISALDQKPPITPDQPAATPSYAMIPGSTPTIPTSSAIQPPIKQETMPPPVPLAPPNMNLMQHQPKGPKPQGGPRPNLGPNLINVDPAASFNTQSLQRELQMRVQQEHDMRIQQQQQRYNQQMFQQQQQQQLQQLQQKQQYPHGANMTFGSAGMGLSHQLQPMQTPHPSLPPMPPMPPMQPPIPSQQKKGLSLTREQMLAAQEMFRSANRVTRAEKALILGFMAGARDNPFPQQGPVITIKLSEETEMVSQADGPQSVFIEMLFEMNYDTGHWRRLKRTRVVSQQ